MSRPRDRTFGIRLLAASVLLVGVALVQAPGLLVPDTKLDLVVAPLDFLGRALHLWDDEGALGQLQNQAYGYLWPMGPFFALGSLLELPGWVVQRLWVALVMVVAFQGSARLARALGVRSHLACLVAGLVFALSPRMLTTLGPISIEAWPSALAPWVLLPLVLGSRAGRPWLAAGLSALAIAMVGGVNAAATFAVIPMAAVWLLTRTPGPRRRALMLWWPLFTLLGTLWWLVPLFVLGAYSPPFLDYIETTSVTTFPTTLFDALRGTSHWVPYVDPGSPAGSDLLRTPYLVIDGAVLLALGVAGLALRSTPERQFLVLSLLVGVLMVTAGHHGVADGWFTRDVRGLLDGPLSALRNVHKFDPVIRLPLALGAAFAIERIVALDARSTLERVNRFAVLGMALVAVAGALVPAATGRLAPWGAALEVPGYWHETADWLDERASHGAALVVPGSPFGDYQWGAPRDEPLQFLADSSWAVRNVIPLTPPGNIRMLDAVESRLAQGDGSAGLTAVLRRAGIRYVVVRNDLAHQDDVPDPVVVHEAIAESPGLSLAASFGPPVGGDAHLGDGDDRVLVNGGWQERYAAVEVFEVDGPVDAAVTSPEPPLVVGGPEDLVDLADLGVVTEAPTVLAAHAEEPRGPVVLTDGLRARQRHFARIHDGASAVRDAPGRDYEVGSTRWATTAEVVGAEALTASSSAADADVVGGTRRGEHPFAALDGDPATAWTSAPLSESAAWWEVRLPAPVESRSVALVGGPGAPADQVVRVRTETGTTEAVELAAGERRTVELPPGDHRTLRVEDATDRVGAVLSLAEVEVPGASFRRRLRLPGLPGEWGGPDAVVLRRDADARRGCATVAGEVRCAPGRGRTSEEEGRWARAFGVGEPAEWQAELTVRPRAGLALEQLALRGQRAAASASSTAVADPRAGALAAVDGDPGTTWLADPDDPRPTLELSWLRPTRVSGLRLVLDDDAAARRPTRVTLQWPDGEREVELADGEVRFPPIRTDRLRMRVDEAEPTSSLDFDGRRTELGVGVGEVRVRGAGALPLRFSEEPVRHPCGTGPEVVVDGRTLQTRVHASPAALLRGEAVPADLCADSSVLRLGGDVEVDARPSPGFVLDALVLRREGVSLPLGGDARAADVEAPGPALRTIRPDGDGVLALRRNTNPGWKARQAGADLDPVVVDGWQQGWVLRDGESTVTAEFAPDRVHRTGLLLGALAFLLLLALVLVGLRRPRVAGPAPSGPRRVPALVLLGGAVAGAGLVAGWPGVAVATGSAVVVAVLLRRAPDALPWLLAVPLLAVGSAYAVRPWGSSAGWAGEWGWTVYLALVPLVGLLVASVEPRRRPSGRRSFRRRAGRSTSR